jgi:hypothetical protein
MITRYFKLQDAENEISKLDNAHYNQTFHMKKIFFYAAIILLLILVALNLLDVITNKYITASTYFVSAFLVGWAHSNYTSSKEKNTHHS